MKRREADEARVKIRMEEVRLMVVMPSAVSFLCPSPCQSGPGHACASHGSLWAAFTIAIRHPAELAIFAAANFVTIPPVEYSLAASPAIASISGVI